MEPWYQALILSSTLTCPYKQRTNPPMHNCQTIASGTSKVDCVSCVWNLHSIFQKLDSDDLDKFQVQPLPLLLGELADNNVLAASGQRKYTMRETTVA